MTGFNCGRFFFYCWFPTNGWFWRPDFHCTGCCYFWLQWGCVEVGVYR